MMRCRQAKLRLANSHPIDPASPVDQELQEHLKNCPACAEEAYLAGRLDKLFAAAKAGDASALPALADQRRLVEARLVSPGDRPTVKKLKKRLTWGYGGGHPVWSLAGAAAALALVTLTLLPFKQQITIGYHVALAGVDLELAENSDHICEMLDGLGLTEVAVDVLECDTTCRVVIFDLKSRDEVDLMLAALTDANEVGLTSDVIPVRTSATRSWWSRKTQETE